MPSALIRGIQFLCISCCNYLFFLQGFPAPPPLLLLLFLPLREGFGFGVEERKKALFSPFRQSDSVVCVLFCPFLEG